MKRIEYFCRNIRHGDPIEEQMEEAKKGGIIKSYRLTTLSAMNARRNADLCLWCDEIWSADHIHSCLCVPDHNCMFTCGIDFEVFAFVKVGKEGLKQVLVNVSQGEAVVHCADKVFDELSQPIVSTNPWQIIEENQDNDALTSNFDNNNEMQADDESTHGQGNEETQTNGIRSSLIQHSMDEVYEFEGESDKKFIKEIQKPSVCKMLNELPLPTFIKEIAEASKITEVQSIQGDYELEPAIQKVQDDHFTHKQLCAKLPHKVDESYGNSYFECPCSRVSFKSSITLNTNNFISFIDNVLSPLMLSDVDWFMGSSLSQMLGVQANNTRVFESVVNRKTFLTFKELYSWGIHSSYCQWAWLELPLGAENFVACLGRAYNSSDYLTSCIFIYDPGDLLFSATSSGLGFSSRYNSRACMIVGPFGDLHTFDPRGNVNSSCGGKLWQVGQLQLLLLSDSMLCSIIALCGLVNDKIHAFISLPKWNTWPLLSTLEDKGDFRGEEDTSKEYNRELFTPLTFRSHFSASKTIICFVLLSYIFDPGGFVFCVGRISMVVLDDWSVKLMLFSFKSISTYSMIVFALIHVLEVNDGSMGDNVAAYSLLYDTIMHDLELIINQGTNVHAHVVNANFQGLVSHKLEITNLFLGLAHLSFDMVCYKGDFEEVGNDMGLLLWLRMSSSRYVRNHLTSNWNILMTMTCSSLCFDPGGLQTKFCALALYGLLRVATYMESTCVWIFDPGRNNTLSGSTNIMSKSHLVHVIGTNGDGMMHLMFFSNHKNDLFQSGVAGYVCTLYMVHHDGFASVNSEKMSKSLLNHFLVGHMKQFPVGDYLVSTHSYYPMDCTELLLRYGNKSQNASTLIFDPGGFKSWNYADYQIYVFDPGGPLMRLVMDPMVTNSKTWNVRVISCFKFHLSLILEDKDRFKRRVLIHFKMRLRVA